jgi:CheY-like chemotaxis protein
MGAMAVTMNLRLDESGGRLPHVPVVMLLDRIADVHLARRSGAEAWLVKPIDSLRLRRAVNEVCSGGTWHESAPPMMQNS